MIKKNWKVDGWIINLKIYPDNHAIISEINGDIINLGGLADAVRREYPQITTLGIQF